MIKGNALRLFHPDTFQMATLALSQATNIGQFLACCYIRTDTLLCRGGYRGVALNEVYEVNVRTGSVDKASNMSIARYFVGIFCTNQQAFVAVTMEVTLTPMRSTVWIENLGLIS